MLLAEIRFLDLRVLRELFRVAFHYDSTGLEHVRAIGVMKRGVGILFYEENRRAFVTDLFDGFEDRMNN